jgi:hypothetical protein
MGESKHPDLAFRSLQTATNAQPTNNSVRPIKKKESQVPPCLILAVRGDEVGGSDGGSSDGADDGGDDSGGGNFAARMVQKGTLVMANTDLVYQESIVNVDPESAILIFTYKTSGPEARATMLLGKLNASGDAISFHREAAGSDIHISWHVIQKDSIKVVRGELQFDSGTGVTLSDVALGKSFNLAHSFVHLSSSTESLDLNKDELVSSELIDSSTLRLTRGGDATLVKVAFQVVEYQGADVYSGDMVFDAALTSVTHNLGRKVSNPWLIVQSTTTSSSA